MKSSRGFTLIELLVVIAIIGVLASVVMNSVNSARANTKTSKAKAELQSLRAAISSLEDDTGKWPNGCPVATSVTGSGNEIRFSFANAGIISIPSVGVTDNTTDPPCEWTAEEVSAWKGPYMPNATDPWGNPYWFDSDYYPRLDCGNPTATAVVVVESHGPNGVGGAQSADYDCDDIYLELH